MSSAPTLARCLDKRISASPCSPSSASLRGASQRASSCCSCLRLVPGTNRREWRPALAVERPDFSGMRRSACASTSAGGRWSRATSSCRGGQASGPGGRCCLSRRRLLRSWVAIARGRRHGRGERSGQTEEHPEEAPLGSRTRPTASYFASTKDGTAAASLARPGPCSGDSPPQRPSSSQSLPPSSSAS